MMYFHGTNTTAKAESIQIEGLQPNRPSVYAPNARPFPGGVSLSRHLTMAVRHAGWPCSGRWSNMDADQREHPSSYIFVVPEFGLANSIIPDQDDVAMFVMSHAVECGRRENERVDIDGESVTVREYLFHERPEDSESADKRQVWEELARHLTPRQMTRLDFDVNTAAIGRHLLGQIIDNKTLIDALLHWGNGNVLHLGGLTPSEAWRVPKTALQQIKTYENLQEFGEPWPVSMAHMPIPQV
jgi:hypothetical protein